MATKRNTPSDLAAARARRQNINRVQGGGRAERWAERRRPIPPVPFRPSRPPEEVIDAWFVSLRSRSLSRRTLQGYRGAVELLLRWCRGTGRTQDVTKLTVEDLEAFFGQEIDRTSAVSANNRYRALRQLWKWLAERRLIVWDLFEALRAPRMPERPPPLVPVTTFSAMLSTCRSTRFHDIRDRAILLLLRNSGVRVGELVGVDVEDIHWEQLCVSVTGKGSRQRLVPMDPGTARAIEEYIIARRSHPLADLERLWLGERAPLTDDAVRHMLRRRAARAEVGYANPHRYRHTFAHDYLFKGGQEGDLMRLVGWKSRQMVDRYAKSTQDERAIAAYRRIWEGLESESP